MTEQENRVADILRSLQERAKELNCLYRIEEIINAEVLTLDEVFRGVIEAVSSGWQYPDVCVARIRYDNEDYTFGYFRETEWIQKASIRVYGKLVGTLEVAYTEPMPQADEGPFLKEERKLLETIAERIGSCITHRQLLDAMDAMRGSEGGSPPRNRGWSAILDLLRCTDQSLLMRVARKMINHLCWSGVKDARELLQDFRPVHESGEADVFFESNRPRGRETAPSATSLSDQGFQAGGGHAPQR